MKYPLEDFDTSTVKGAVDACVVLKLTVRWLPMKERAELRGAGKQSAKWCQCLLNDLGCKSYGATKNVRERIKRRRNEIGEGFEALARIKQES